MHSNVVHLIVSKAKKKKCIANHVLVDRVIGCGQLSNEQVEQKNNCDNHERKDSEHDSRFAMKFIECIGIVNIEQHLP